MQEIVKEANAAIGTNAIVAARRLPSGDSKAKWEGNSKFLEVFGVEAKFRTKEYTVLTYRVQTIIFNTDDQTKAIAEIYYQNPRLEGRVKIVRVGRAKKDAGKQSAPLYIGVAEPEQANHRIEQGLIWEAYCTIASPFSKNAESLNAFNAKDMDTLQSTAQMQCNVDFVQP